MGHRQDLLEAAKRLMTEHGYTAITARDLVAASGTNLASIGYHFGSKDSLLMAAILEAYDERDGTDDAVAALPPGSPAQRLRAFLDGLRADVAAQPHLYAAGVHAIARSENDPENRRRAAEAYAGARRAFTALILDRDPDALDEHAVHTVGSLGLAIVNGAVVQWLLDPATAPDGAALAEAIQVLAD